MSNINSKLLDSTKEKNKISLTEEEETQLQTLLDKKEIEFYKAKFLHSDC